MNYLMKVLMLICIPAFSQNQFSLQDCINYTLNHHKSLKVYENNAEIAINQSKQALGMYLPAINGSASMLDNLQLQTSILPAGIVGSEAVNVQFGTKYNTSFGLNINQTIFDKSKLVAIKANEPYREITELQIEQNKETLMLTTANAYFQVLIYQEQLKLLNENKIKYEEMLKVLNFQFAKGVVLEKDVDRVKVSLNSTIYQMEDAKTKEALALSTLKNAMGMDLKENISVDASINYENFAEMPLKNELDLSKLTDTKINELTVSIQEYNVKAKKAEFLPTLTAVGAWNKQALNDEFSNVWDKWNDYSYIGLSLNLPIFNGFIKKNSLKEEKLKLENEKVNYKIKEENLKLRFDTAKSSIFTAYSTYLTNKENMDLAMKVLSVTDYQYQRGVANLIDYLNDDNAYKSAQTNYLNSLYNLLITQLNYQNAQGSLAEFLNNIK